MPPTNLLAAPQPAPQPAPTAAPPSRGAGLAVALVGVLLAMGAHLVVPAVGTLTWAVLLGTLAANTRALPVRSKTGLTAITRRLLRTGVVLLGFSLSVVAIARLGLPVIGLVVVTLGLTLGLTTWLGLRLGLGRSRSLLVATGFAICGASAIAAMEENAEADEDDVAVAIAMVTICGTAAMVVVPLLQGPLGLTDVQLGVWAGASVHEVGQVVAAASPAGAAAVGVAVLVKLTRVLLLAPVVAGVGVVRRNRLRAHGTVDDTTTAPPLVPLFVVGFLACVGLRSAGAVPSSVLAVIGQLQTVVLGAALFGMGTAVHLPTLFRSSGRALVLAVASTLVVAGVSLAGVYTLT
jgi:uncharacterized integral membrane protein (TIGR00698 family)